MHVHDLIGPVDVEQMLAQRLGPLQHPAVQQGGGRREAALRTGHLHRGPGVAALVPQRQPVRGVALRHATISARVARVTPRSPRTRRSG